MISPLPRLVVETSPIDPVEELLPFADAESPLCWVRRAEGIAGFGEALRLQEPGGQESSAGSRNARVVRLADAWRDVASQAQVDDAVGVPGTGLVAFGAFSFTAASAASSVLIVPRVIVGRRGGRGWITTIRTADQAATQPFPHRLGPYWPGAVGPGRMTHEGYQSAVRDAVAAIGAGEIGKVVLARDLVGSVPHDADLRRLVRALATDYPDCWTFAVDGLIGASPETLVTVHDGTVTARVLAGTRARGADADADNAASLTLATSAKDLDEHRYAAHSVLSSLRPHTSALASSEQPFTLKLPNVWHLATDIEGTLDDGASSLDLVAALHPTAAVAGSPTEAALAVIRRLEPFDRGRYAGPVGWVDQSGNGEWAIALRCAQFGLDAIDTHGDGISVVAHAGAGIVAGSDPEAELLETRVKFRPIVDALA
ncbi:chorismate-binding protein [Microbacterium sp. ET2]|uniref:isochorismate synthase n=1 Tax=Microbacterium albipurpureum TaxID=3050384 RepID=UPI00259CB641|nr:chorismate-binding protein [Microbacterium sp. ET2 (Ac-2212)]WJL96422.1 chorismate-binding protein [Microbacterium sp. ET2 (Ac-2212)]